MNTFLEIYPELLKALNETMIMLVVGISSSVLIGGAIGIYLYLWNQEKLLKNSTVYFLVGTLVNIVRSFPFVILMIAVGPFSRWITGSTIGPLAASVPLSIAGIAYFSRLVELALNDVPKGTIEAAQSMGASLNKIVFSVLLVEARSSLILGATSLFVSYLSYSAVAGVIGGGGLGDLAIRYGYYRFQTEVMLGTVIGLIIFVQGVQSLGLYLSKKMDMR